MTASAAMFDGHVEQISPEFGVSTVLPEAPVGRPPSDVIIQLQ
jgi:prepilin-type processing-associated H-X9-DG protein